MIRIMLKTIFVVLLWMTSNLHAQEFTGVATYKTAASVNFEMKGDNMPEAQKEQMKAMLSKAMQKEFELQFNKTESVWKEQESLGGTSAAPMGGGGMRVVFAGAGGDNIRYKNSREQNYILQTDVFGKMFRVQDSLEHYNWQLTDETKQIGEYTCFKATAEREITISSMSFGDDDEEEEDTPKEEKKIITITAWYTPQIPVNHGPDTFWGLPGLILEVGDANRVMVCNKIVLNPSEKVVIEAPSKGEVVTNEEYRKIMQKKMEEMEKMYEGDRKKDGNRRNVKIRIGGQ